MVEGVDAISIPTVAERAKVSIGTVYRHFGDKAGLMKALIPYAARRSGTVVGEPPTTMEEFDAVLRNVFLHFERTDDLMWAAFATRLGREARMEWSEDRLRMMRTAFESMEPAMSPEHLDHMSRLATMLTTSDTYRDWKERLGLTPDEAADEVMWTIRTLLEALRS
jgi:AcrR family transcriptional regulator